MIVDRTPDASTMLFQVLDDDINNYTLEVDDPFLSDHSKFKQKPLLIDTSLRAIIDERNVYTQIDNAYYEIKKDSFLSTLPVSFYNTPDKVYKLDDFTRFPTMEDVFREYVPEVVVKRSKENFTLQVVNPYSGYPYQNEPLMLINGVAILETNTLMAYDPLKIERIEIVNSKYFYGSLESDGIISLKTYKGAMEDLPSFNSHHEKMVKMQTGGTYSFPEYSPGKKELDRVPDYRVQLYWNPGVSVTKEQVTTLEFYTSDVVGDFEILVEGFSMDGVLVSTRDVLSVVK
jgi:hypothetical protein